jgi:aspartyl-tRNA(Asn)/glutamyl-tRNA(Gln) amidotransferase subunit A
MAAVAGVRGDIREDIREVFARIRAADRTINAFTALTEERASAAGERKGPLAGIPFAVKNLFDIKGLPTLAGSKINRELPPAREDAFLVRKLEQAGAILVGALNMDEYAYGFTTENTHYGPTRNPRDPAKVAGGSSGGSAAAVAAGMVPLTLGSDTNGSIRVPASFCGVWGLKPTYGRLSRAGTFPFVASLDHVGPLAASLELLAKAYDALQGPDPADPASAGRPVEPVFDSLQKRASGLRIGLAGGYFEENCQPAVYALVKKAAAALGAKKTVEVPYAAQGRAAAFVITASESAQLHLPNLRERIEDFEPNIQERLLAGAMIPAAWYLKAQRVRRAYYRKTMDLFQSVDVILAPATPWTAQRIGQETIVLNGKEHPVRPNTGLLTQPISCIGLPVVCAPVGELDGMPVGMQVIAAPWREDLCFRVAGALP